MSKLKKFLIVFLSFLPLSAAAVWPWLIGIGASLLSVAGYSIYRSVAPVNMVEALTFFSSCWTCNLFSAVMKTLSGVIVPIYSALGEVMIPIAAVLIAIYFAVRLVSGFLNSKIEGPWNIATDFTTMMLRFMIASILLIAPLPRVIADVAVEPVFNIGLGMNHLVGDSDNFSECMVATTLMDGAEQTSLASEKYTRGAFSTHLRSGLACEIANVHQMTGLGLTVGWTMMNMAFNYEYMHRVIFDIPILPNIPILFAGVIILALFLWALLPIPLYFLEIFVTLTMDLIMLPFMLLSWIFKEWKIFPQGSKSIKAIIDDVITGAVGISMTVLFLIFATMFLDAVAGGIGALSTIQLAIAENDSTIFLDGLLMQNDSLIGIIIMGVFFVMFMTSIPALIKTLFSVNVSDKFYQTTKNDFNAVKNLLGKWWKVIKK